MTHKHGYNSYHFLAVHALNKLPYSKLDSKSLGIKEGVIFSTYSSLIASSEKGRSRLQQLVQWFGSDYDGLILFDEVPLPTSFLLLLAITCMIKLTALFVQVADNRFPLGYFPFQICYYFG